MRNPITVEFYPFEMSVESFVSEISNGVNKFGQNMVDLKAEARYAEEWFSMFGAWMEMHPPEESEVIQ